MIKDTFKEAEAFHNKSIWDLTEDEVAGLVSGQIKASNPCYSENLSAAAHAIQGTNNADLNEAFQEAATILMTGDHAKQHGNGFSHRSNLGAGIYDMLRDGNTHQFDRYASWAKNELPDSAHKSLGAALKVLRAELKAHCAENGVKLHSTGPSTAPAQSPRA